MSFSNVWQIPGSGAEINENVFAPAMMAEWAPKAMALIHPQLGQCFLDVACVTGVFTHLVKRSLGSDGRVVGLDLNPDMLAVAQNLTKDSSTATPIEWRLGDACTIPLENESFDIVFCEFGLMSIPDRVAALKEMHRVLMPGGRLTISVWGSISKCPGQMAIKESFEHHFGIENSALFYRQHVLGNAELVQSLVDEAGFKDVSVQTAMGVVRFPSPEHLVRYYGALAGIPTDENTSKMVIDEVSQTLHSFVGAQGLEYPIEAILGFTRK
jgi:SAM-dependent methyltransferase